MLLDSRIDALLEPLTPSRRAHSLEVGRKAASAVDIVAQHLRDDLVVAAYLHDVGYGHPTSGFHPLDGARLLATLGYSDVVCHLVANHTCSKVEARHRGIPASEFVPFELPGPEVEQADKVLWWADLTTGPNGETFTVEERIDEIMSRYGSEHIVGQSIRESAPVLRAVCQSVIGSMYGSA